MRKQRSRYRYDKCHVFIDSRVPRFRALAVRRTVPSSLRYFIFTYIKCHVDDTLRLIRHRITVPQIHGHTSAILHPGVNIWLYMWVDTRAARDEE